LIQETKSTTINILRAKKRFGMDYTNHCGIYDQNLNYNKNHIHVDIYCRGMALDHYI
jgi:hypothetical protein